MKRLFLLGFISTLVFLSIYAPAQLLGSIIGHYSHGRLSFASSQGSLWHGSANLLLISENNHVAEKEVQGNFNAVNLGKLSWDVLPMQLLAARLSASLTWNEGAPFWITLDTSRLHIEHATFNLPPEIISMLAPTLNAAQLGGQLSVNCDNFSLTQNEILGQLSIDWDQASSPLSVVNPLGNYNIQLDGRGSVLDITLHTKGDNPLMMQGNGRWVASEGLHFEGTAEANDANKSKLQELLRVMGNEATEGSGRYQLKF